MLVVAEIVFASDPFGYGMDRSIWTGFSDKQTIKILLRSQRTIARAPRRTPPSRRPSVPAPAVPGPRTSSTGRPRTPRRRLCSIPDDDALASLLAELRVAPLPIRPRPNAVELALIAHASHVRTGGGRIFLVASADGRLIELGRVKLLVRGTSPSPPAQPT